MKRRIQFTDIQKEKLALNEDTERMKAFFERELSRFQRRGARRAEVRTEADCLRRELDERTKEVETQRVEAVTLNKQLDDMTTIIRRQMQLFKHIERTWQPKNAPKEGPPTQAPEAPEPQQLPVFPLQSPPEPRYLLIPASKK